MATRVIAAQDKTSSGAGDDVQIKAGNANTSGAGGSIILQPGSQVTTGGDGFVQIKGTGSSTILKLTESAYNRSFTWTQDYSGASLSADGGLGGIILFSRFYIDTGGKIRSAYNNYVGLGNSNSQNYDNWGYIYLRNDGVINWWGDVGLTYGSVGQIRVSNASTGGGSLAYTSSTPTALSTNPTNDLVLTGSAFQRLSSSSALSVTGIAPPSTGSHVDGRLIWLYNVGSFNITLKHSQTSTAANQFINEGSGDVVLGPGRMVQAIYDSTSSKWRVNGETYPYVFPTADGTNGQVLTTNGSGTLSWTTVSAGASASGTTNYIAKFTGASTLGNSLVYDDGSNVGIGTTSSLGRLDVVGANVYEPIRGITNSASNLESGSNNALGLSVNNSNTTAGNGIAIGFNTATTNSTLYGVGAIGFNNLTHTTLGVPQGKFQVITRDSGGGLTPKLTIDTSGNVGVGTASPDTRLHIYHAGQPPISDSLYASMILDTDSTANFQRIRFDVGTTPYWGIMREGTTNNFVISGRINGSWSDNVLVATTSGNVGVGNASPGARLQVDTGATGTKGQIIKAFLGQSANLSEWQDSTGTVLSYVNSSGEAWFNGVRVGAGPAGTGNTVLGSTAGNSNTGNYNTFIGWEALYNKVAGANNVAVGADAGYFQADGSTALTTTSNSIYIGTLCRGFNNSDSNSIVIGYQAIGKGANTTVLGNTSTTASYVYGDNLYLGNGAGSQVNIGPLARTTSGAGAAIRLSGGDGVTSGNGGTVYLWGGYGPAGNGGDVFLRGGDSGGGTRDGTVISKVGGNGNYNCHEFRYGIAATYAFFDQLGRFCITPGTSTTAIPADATIYAATRSSATRGLIVKGAATQSANLTEWQDSTGTVVAAVSPTGAFTGSSFTPYGTINSTTTIFGNNYWTPNLSGVSNPSTGTFTKTTATAAWDSQVYSSEGYTKNVYCAARASQTNGAIMFGLNSDPAANASYSSLDYAWYFEGNSNLYIYENNAQIGSNYGTYTTSTVLSITYDGENVRYWKDGVLQRTVARSTGNPLYFDTSFYTQNASLNSVQFGPIGQPFGISGTAGYHPKFTSQQTLGNSIVYDNGTNVGIGTASPSNNLSIGASAGKIGFQRGSGDGEYCTIGFKSTTGNDRYVFEINNSSGTGELRLNQGGTSTPIGMTFYTNNAEKMRIDSSGNVGIGTASPSFKLQVDAASVDANIVANVTSGYGGIGVYAAGTNKVILGYVGANTNYGSQTVAGDIALKTNNSNLHINTGSGNSVTTAYFSSAGNVGIGNVSPGARLQVDTGATGTKGQIIKAVASQTANLSEWQNNSGTALSYVASNGDIYSTTSFVHYSSGNSGYYLKRPSDNATVASFTWSSGSVEASLYALAFLNLDVATGSGIRMGNWTTWADSVNAQVMWLKNSNIIWGNNALGVTGRTAFNTSAFQITAGSYATIPAPTSRFEVYGDSQFLSQSTSAKTVVVKAAASQTANLTEWQNNSGTALAYMDANGNFAAVTKSFLIPHPTPAKAAEGKKLRYASLEGPENGVYFRGTLTGENEIILPDYWKDLVDPDSITVNLTARKRPQPNLFVVDANAEKVIVESDREICCDFIVYATRKDIAKLEVEPDGN